MNYSMATRTWVGDGERILHVGCLKPLRIFFKEKKILFNFLYSKSFGGQHLHLWELTYEVCLGEIKAGQKMHNKSLVIVLHW